MLYFKINLPAWERTFRVLVGLSALCATYLFPIEPWMRWSGFAVGAILAVTGFVGFCPMCALAGRRLTRSEP